MDDQVLDRRRSSRDFWLGMLIPSGLLVGLLVFLLGSAPSEAIPHVLAVAGAALLAGGAIGTFTGVRGPHWPIYALIFIGLAVLLLLPSPWQGLALVPVPAASCGYAMGKEIGFFRVNRHHVVPPVRI